jgi:Putative Actinobacterial Holin-X, holin superfamily III
VVLAAAAGILALLGKGKVQQATPPVPEQAIDSAREDVETAKSRAQEGRR